MAWDAHANFALSAVVTAPSPATSGTSLTVTAGTGSRFPAAPFNITIWPAGAQPSATNAEIARVTAVSTDTFTITRAQEGTTAMAVATGYQVAATITKKTLTDVETGVDAAANASNLTSGTVPDARFPATLPALSGVNLTSLNATNLASGTVNNARLPSTISVANVEVTTLLTLAGGQAKFPATQVASSDAHTLDDYEEGIWTPTFTNLTIGNGTTAGVYIKVGKLVFFSLRITLGTTSSVSGTITFSLPFTSAQSTKFNIGTGYALDTGVASYPIMACIAGSTTTAEMLCWATGASYSSRAFVNATAPFTFGSTDEITISGAFEASA